MKESSPPFFSSPLFDTLMPSSSRRLRRWSASAAAIPRPASLSRDSAWLTVFARRSSVMMSLTARL